MIEFQNDKFLKQISLSQLNAMQKISSFRTVRGLDGNPENVLFNLKEMKKEEVEG